MPHQRNEYGFYEDVICHSWLVAMFIWVSPWSLAISQISTTLPRDARLSALMRIVCSLLAVCLKNALISSGVTTRLNK